MRVGAKRFFCDWAEEPSGDHMKLCDEDGSVTWIPIAGKVVKMAPGGSLLPRNAQVPAAWAAAGPVPPLEPEEVMRRVDPGMFSPIGSSPTHAQDDVDARVAAKKAERFGALLSTGVKWG